MGSIAEAVEHYLQEDIALLDTLARGTASLRRTARWLIEEHGIDGTEEAVVSAIRRYIQNQTTPPLARDRRLLRKTHVNVHTGLSLFILPRSIRTQRRLERAWATIEPRDPISIWHEHKTFRLLVQEEQEDELRRIFPPAYCDDIQSPLSAIKLRLPDEPQAISIIGHATSTLVHHRIPVLGAYTCLPEATLLVPTKDTSKAYDAIARLTRQFQTRHDATA